MQWKDALKLKINDEVTVRKTMFVEEIVDIVLDEEKHSMMVMLSDGRWYSYKELRG